MTGNHSCHYGNHKEEIGCHCPQETYSHHTSQEITPRRMAALFLNKLWIKAVTKIKHTDNLESHGNNNTTWQHIWVLLCLIPTSVHGISPDSMLEPSVCASLFDIEMTYIPPSAFQTSHLYRSQHIEMPLPPWGPFSPLVLEISFLVMVLQKVLLQTLIFFLGRTGNFPDSSSFCPLEENL